MTIMLIKTGSYMKTKCTLLNQDCKLQISSSDEARDVLNLLHKAGCTYKSGLPLIDKSNYEQTQRIISSLKGVKTTKDGKISLFISTKDFHTHEAHEVTKAQLMTNLAEYSAFVKGGVSEHRGFTNSKDF